ncbi:MAG: hypothetical protein GTO62_06715, partial [Planctomycetales bacterium]|nr:hypothetical protein [Planctomycetales bacterium]NIP68945.1 hypothetical protein [Planctomycetales bacterium]
MSVKESSVPQSSQAKKEDSGSIGSLSLSKKLFFAFGVFAIFLLLMEATFRLLGIRPAIVQMSETERFQIVSDELL